MKNIGDVLYRVEPDWDRHGLHFDEWPIVKVTEKGYWIGSGKWKFILAEGHKRFAYPTEQEAMQSFLRRKQKQIRIVSHKLAEAASFAEMAEDWLEKSRVEIL